MKYTEKSQAYVDVIDSAIFAISSIYDEKSFMNHIESGYLISSLNRHSNELKKINCREIDREFWDLCSDVDKIRPVKRVFEVRFSNLLLWRIDLSRDLSEFYVTLRDDVMKFVERQHLGTFQYTQEDIDKLMGVYWDIVFVLCMIQSHIKELLTQWENMSITSGSHNIANESIRQLKELGATKTTIIKLYPKRKTDFIKILSAMYDSKMFADNDGNPLTNKQKLMEAFGEFLGDDFSAYSTSLSQAKIRDRKTFMKPFTEIEKAAERYLEE